MNHRLLGGAGLGFRRELIAETYRRIGSGIPTCLERDFNIPALPQLAAEVGQIAFLQRQIRATERQVA